jgi:hypothetical protein
LVVFSALLPAAGALEAGVALEAAPPELVELDELLQAAITKAAASPAGTSHTLFITYPRSPAHLASRLPNLDTQITKLPAGLFAGPGQVAGAIEAKPPAALQSVAGGRLAWRADEILCRAFWAGQPGWQPQRPDPTGRPSRQRYQPPPTQLEPAQFSRLPGQGYAE